MANAVAAPDVTGNVFVRKTPEVFTYDLDGNLTSDGRWNYYWDGENRLVKVESRPDTPQTSWRRVEWQYDGLGRRVRQTTSLWTNNMWRVIEDVKFVSDPMLFGRHIVELNATNNFLVRTYVWGIDLSGTIDGAGGVGGLLWVNQHTGSSAGAHFCAYDGNGNVVALVSANTSTETARYEYGPFGEPIRITGPMSKENPFRFSTKRTDNTTDLVLYEYRAYSPSTGRWPNRDPNGEPGFEVLRRRSFSLLAGGLNRYLFVGDTPLNRVDHLGLDVWVIKECSGISHRWVVGSNADGTYWSSDFMPNARTLFGRLYCMGTVNFRANELTLIPTNLPSGYCIERHVTANQAATDEAKKLASRVAKCNKCSQRRYIPGLYDCRHWAKKVADTAEYHQKNCDPDSGEKPKEGEK